MNYGQVITQDVANGPGMRISLFVSGCSHHCRGCFNEKTWDPNYGLKFTEEMTDNILKELSKPYYQGITILGGEPFEPYNMPDVCSLLSKVKEQQFKKDIWIYSGALYEDLMKNKLAQEILNMSDVLVDGPFILEQRNLMLKYRGSANQRIIDLKKSVPGHISLSRYMKKDA